MFIDEGDYLAHYGTPRRSGRYPWGSGKDPHQGGRDFLSEVGRLRKEGLSESAIASAFGLNTSQLRAYKTIAKNEKKHADILQATRLKESGHSITAIGKRMGINESSVRELLKPSAQDKADVLTSTASMLQKQVAEKGYIDVGSGVENQLGVSRGKLDSAIAMAEAEGYSLHNVKIQQLGTGEFTTVKVLAPPGTTQKEVWTNRNDIRQITEFSDDGGRTFLGLHPPQSVDSSRVQVKYGPEGGAEADGVIFVRPGVSDISLGKANYAQVRVAVDGSHYLKGMAIYKDDLPDGVDLQFNTNKTNTGNKLDALKPMKTLPDGTIDPDNPFGSAIKRQIVDVDSKGKEKLTSSMNIVNEEGDWDGWSRNLSTQMLSKQNVNLAKSQLDVTYERRKSELDEISTLTNPVVKRKLLDEYADSVDSSAVHLAAAAMPRQATQVILPVKQLKDNEIYAPNFRDGERVALVRYPHGGTFEIPELVVNNRNPAGKKLLGQAKDAVGINHRVAERLSGADFDGDSVVVIPNNSGKVKSSPALKGLKDFDPQVYKIPKGSNIKPMTAEQKGYEMGKVSNLITDMTIRGASQDEIASAVRHSMVVIDGEKHKLNYKQSAEDNNIAALAKKYQGKSGGGASTLISRATSEKYIDERKPRSAAKGGAVDPATGKLMWEPTGRMVRDAKGNEKPRTQKIDKLALTDDANTLSSGSPIEAVYATHSNRLKALANQARRESVSTKDIPYSPSAKKAYAPEVASLDAKLNIAKQNQPRERQAQIVANGIVSAKRKANPNLEKDEVKKIKSQALNAARARVGANKKRIEITDGEWAAIQAGAISTHKLEEILRNSDVDTVRERATPRAKPSVSAAKKSRAKTMLAAGYTQAEVADALGLPLSTLTSALDQ